jgi:long-subunit fatty acid transport protein
VPSDTIDPSLPDADKHSVAAGLGYDFGKIHLDLAYMLVVPKDREVDNVLETGATPLDHNGEYSATVHEFGVSVGYVF